MVTDRFMRSLERLAALQAKRPVLVIVLAALTAVPAFLCARELELRTGFDELLPNKQPSVLELRRVSERLPGISTLAVTAESKNTELLKDFIDEVTPEIRKLPADLVSGVEGGTREAQDFFERHQHLYADLGDLATLRDDVVGRYDWEVGNQLGTNIDDEAPPAIVAESIRQRFQKRIDDVKASSPGLDGYFIDKKGDFAVLLVRTPLRAMSQRAFELQDRISALVESGRWKKQDPAFRFGFTGNLVTSAEEYRDVRTDLTQIGVLGIAFVLLVVFLFFWRLRVLVAMALSIGLGCLWTLAFAEAAIGHLNTATGFLVSVIAGNGINSMIIYMARFVEARRDERLDVAAALSAASLRTWSGTLAAVGVAIVSYGALMTTEFRGFRHFGIIGAAGMLLCWIATYSFLPAVLVLADRLRPFAAERQWCDRLGGWYGKPFIWVAKRFANPLLAGGVVLGALGLFATVRYFLNDPMEYDLRNVRNEIGGATSAQTLSARMDRVVGSMNQGGRAVLVDRVDQIVPLVAELERRREAAPAARKPFSKIATLQSLLPEAQERKIEILTEIKDRVRRARDRGWVSQQDFATLQGYLPDDLKPVGINDLPELVARPFEEKDGTRGRIVYVAPAQGRSVDDANYLMEWADSIREVALPNGDVIRASGDPVVFADMLRTIARDAPRVALLSLLGTVGVILLSFRGRSGGWIALSTLALGLSWMVGMLYLFDVKLNFLNFVALPIAIGVGSDYAINVMKRRELEGDDGIEKAFTETGGAVVACSMTTLSGYAALIFSINGAVKSLGITASLGELFTQLASMLVLPAALYWFAARRLKRLQFAELPRP
jgi:uncharacterized protein